MALTPEQQKLMDRIQEKLDDDQQIYVLEFQNVCQFEGLSIPSDEDVRAALKG